MKTVILVAFAVLSLGVGAAHAQSQAHSDPSEYHAPAHNFYQNNWMSSGD